MIAAIKSVWEANRIACSLAAVIFVGIVLSVTYLKGRYDGVWLERVRAAEATGRADLKDAKADARSGVQAERDAAAVAAREESLNEIVREAPDGRPSVLRCRLNRERLLRNGADPSKLPACG